MSGAADADPPAEPKVHPASGDNRMS